jgi:hypothetical protein
MNREGTRIKCRIEIEGEEEKTPQSRNQNFHRSNGENRGNGSGRGFYRQATPTEFGSGSARRLREGFGEAGRPRWPESFRDACPTFLGSWDARRRSWRPVLTGP